jgi:tetratricopeptide (TPR) repeat protein
MKPKKTTEIADVEILLEEGRKFSDRHNYARAVKCINSVLDLASKQGLTVDQGRQVDALIASCIAPEIDTALGQTVLGKVHLLLDRAPLAAPYFKRALKLSIEDAKKKKKPSLHPGEFYLNYGRAMMCALGPELSTATDEELDSITDEQIEEIDKYFSSIPHKQLEDIESSFLTARELGLPGSKVNAHIMMFYDFVGNESKVREYAQRISDDPVDSENNKEIAKILLQRCNQLRESEPPEPLPQYYN